MRSLYMIQKTEDALCRNYWILWNLSYWQKHYGQFCRQESGADKWIYKKIAEDTKSRKGTGKEI